MKLKKVKIDRRHWSRGALKANALLVGRETVNDAKQDKRDDRELPTIGKMCCLGFACRAVGVGIAAMRNHSLPESIQRWTTIPGLTDTEKAKDFCADAAEVNDNPVMDDFDREEKLKELAAKNGFDFVFVH